MQHLAIREFGLLHRGGSQSNVSNQSLIESDWDWLRDHAQHFAQDSGQFVKPVIKNRAMVLQACNYVGLIQLPSDQVLEILPKISEQDTLEECRSTILKMLTRVHRLPFKQSNDTNVVAVNRPLIEILIGRFLSEAQRVINKGLRFDYQRIEENSAYLRGKLQIHQYAQSPASKRLSFPVEYNEYVSDRPENRLLHWAVQTVYQWTKNNHHRTHARKILIQLSELPASSDPHNDLRQWSEQRLMKHYGPLKPWINLILANQSPFTQKGNNPGMSLLFPMELLFERYVADVIKQQLSPNYSLLHDREGGKLARIGDKFIFSLRPDIQIQRHKKTTSVMDVKWKRLKASQEGSIENLARSDLYQLFAYAEKILPQGGKLFLIYPKSSSFTNALEDIALSDIHTLSVVPFDLEADSVDAVFEYLEYY